ncbi:chaperonin 10-like protein [Phialemonium atrogriseum]|uniref:Chaperonin 10-like protein n=1 Tax=Phialemonium atrogriseum TaxID=1093897 RepID=A0AAJ0BT54_9PEZI|nr:chaperonin 10-like protein [Phialemonium atrogriseum]KAK1763985.1 chaperonin 10-like protein [Phialemonium atrogriseum]
MRAVVLKGVRNVVVEERPIPKIQDPKDIIVKVRYTALCGSELHVFRGHQPSATDFIMGHEFTGVIEQVGSAVQNLQPGDPIVCPFTISCGECFYCARGFSSRCEKCLLFGTPALDGSQAEYVRVPLAETTVVKAPSGIEDMKLCLMADIFPTGFFAASAGLGTLDPDVVSDSVVVLIGCGPVGLCALIAALEYRPRALLAVDGIQARLDTARDLGAEPWNYQTDRQGLSERVKELTAGRGADVVIEVVGLSPALDMGFELLRSWGIISSVGVHNGEIPWTGNQAYGKNLTIKMGRCPVRSIFPQALELLEKKQHLLSFMTETIMPLSQAVEGYEIFDNMKVHKVIFDAAE